MSLDRNKALRVVFDDIQDNKGFGSVFQFWVSQTIHELEEHFPEKEYDYLHKVAVSIVKRIAQDRDE